MTKNPIFMNSNFDELLKIMKSCANAMDEQVQVIDEVVLCVFKDNSGELSKNSLFLTISF